MRGFIVLVAQFLTAIDSRKWYYYTNEDTYMPTEPTLIRRGPTFDPACTMCEKMNYTDCALLPEYDVCAPPAILYYSGEHCLMARAVCLGTFLAIQGTHIKTGVYKLWDQRRAYNASKVFHHRMPDFAEPYRARCSEHGYWEMSTGIKPYEDELIAIDRLYCIA